ncbi:MAG: biotin carboxylase N-terminal domain-containing protein [Acidobacteriota bacterium]|nr:biotin carboxylase N-terminal domain-containing protein [Acidobacteriota bacterium]
MKRLLIANRGEIAVRIIRACRELGIETVAIYSDADRAAPHAREADSAIRIGPPPARESYLDAQKVIDAARQSGADAIHPGYGFLSERAHFAKACEEAGLIFVGPTAASLEQMGSKIGARRLMIDAGVPVVPGETPADQSDAALARAAESLGFPVLIKPSAGGGGIGMKKVWTAKEIAEAAAAARREAIAAVGDGTLYVERLIEKPRHVEIQIVADAHGNIVHLFERECSVQRRHQKTIEESPCVALSDGVRERMGAAAIAAARAINYRNAGTVEFLLDGSGDQARFYFLEMNTRLQVEHPVTECVTGIDLVRTQLLVASGEPLPFTQASLSQRGHAIECRVYAEDPAQGFIPQAGPILLYREPQGPGVRVDSGVAADGDVSVHYDPMLAKVIVWAETRDAARHRALAALRDYAILGIHTNIPFLLRILEHPQFIDATIDTGFLDREGPAIAATISTELPEAALAAVAEHRRTVGTAGTRGTNPLGTPGTVRTVRTDPFLSLGRWRG